MDAREEVLDRVRKRLRGTDLGDRLKVRSLLEDDPDLAAFLRRSAWRLGSKNITGLLNQVGQSTYNVPDIEIKFAEELTQLYSPRRPFLTSRQLKTRSKYYSRYVSRRTFQKRKGLKQSPPFRDLLRIACPWDRLLPFRVTGEMRLGDFTQNEIADILIHLSDVRGEPISVTGLKQIENGAYLKWLFLLAEKEGETDITKIISRLTRKYRSDISIRSSNSNKRIGTLSELITGIVLNTSNRLDPYGQRQTDEFKDNFIVPMDVIYPAIDSSSSKGLHIVFAKKQGSSVYYPDLVIESMEGVCAVEVKNMRHPSKFVLETLVQRLTEGRGYWINPQGRQRLPVKHVALVMHSPESVCRKVADYLEKHGRNKVKVISPSEFREELDISLSQLETEGYLRTQLYSIDDLLRVYDVVSHSQHILMRKDHDGEFRFAENTARDLVHRIQTQEKARKYPQLQIYSTEGTLETNEQGQCRVFKVRLSDIPEDPAYSKARRFIQKRIDNIPDYVQFLDLESTGFQGKQIFLAGIGHREGNDIVYELIFARNPFEEAAMLKYLCDHLRDEIVTFNGTGYDYPALERRLKSHIMRERLPTIHTDLYHRIKQSGVREKYAIEHLKLAELHHLFFGDEKQHTTGSEAPIRYQKWLNTGNPAFIKEIIEHNMIDLIATTAIYALGEEKNSVFSYELP